MPPCSSAAIDPAPCGTIGGLVVRDRSLGRVRGRYVYGDFCAQGLRSVSIRGGRAVGDHALGIDARAISSFGEDAQGRVYVMSVRGRVWRLAAVRTSH